MKAVRRRMTFSNVISMIALFAVIGGGAYAANKISGKKIKKDSIPINRLKGDLPEGPKGDPGEPGQDGADGTALAYAKVSANGTLDVANSKGIASAERIVAGYYCVDPSVEGVENMIASPDISGGGVVKTAAASFEDNFTSCDPGSINVTTWSENGTLTDTAFYLLLN